MRYCEKCGSEIPDGQKFCSECGTPLINANPYEEILEQSALPERKPNKKILPFYLKGWFVVIMCYLIPPVGILLIWLRKDWPLIGKIIGTCVTVFWLIDLIFNVILR